MSRNHPYRLLLESPPAVEPIDATAFKTHSRIDSTAEDDYITDVVIPTVRHRVESFTRRALITQTWQMFFDDWPTTVAFGDQWWDGVRDGADLRIHVDYVEIPKPPLLSIEHIKSYDDSDNATTWLPSGYFVDTASEPGRVVRRTGGVWPTSERVANGIEIQFVAGYGASGAAVPPPILSAMHRYGAYLFEHRGDDSDSDNALIASGAAAGLQPYRIINL